MKNSCLFLFLLVVCSCSKNNTEHLPGGEATVQAFEQSAFSQRTANLYEPKGILAFNLGNDLFEQPWVSRRASTRSRDGLGANFNNNACQNCHVNDGRGHAPDADNDNDFSKMVVKAVRTALSEEQKQQMLAGTLDSVGDSAVGGQLHHRATFGVPVEASLSVDYQTRSVSFADGDTVELRKPIWTFKSNQAKEGHDFDSDTIFSVRIAQQMIGLGLLETIKESDIVKQADPDDKDKDGISGRVNKVWDVESASVQLGRFAWKASQPSIRQQTAGAFVNDLGVTSSIFKKENCQPHQTACLNEPNGNGDQSQEYDFEVPPHTLDNITFYSHHLGVPERRRPNSALVKKGQALFNQADCQSCHTPSYVTGSNPNHPSLAKQRIYPYTDLLLHDMGEELADFKLDNTPAKPSDLVSFSATAHEWRTPPLWGLGLNKKVNQKATFLHDGRARSIMEAVLWHGGEAEEAKNKVLAMSKQEREALLAFLEDL